MTVSVSIIVPALNAERWLHGCIANLQDVLNTAQDDSEVIFVDNGSQDRTLEILRDVEKNDARFHVVSTPEPGIVGALNLGLTRARHAWVMRHDVDDFSHPRRIPYFQEALAHINNEQMDQLAMVAAHTVLASTKNQVIAVIPTQTGIGPILPRLKPVNSFIHGSLVLKKSAIDSVGGYRTALAHAEDVDLWQRLGMREFTVLGIPLYLYWFRYHKQSISSVHLLDQVSSMESLSPSERDGVWSPLDRGIIRELLWWDRHADAIRWAAQRFHMAIPRKRDFYQVVRLIFGVRVDYIRGLFLKFKEPEIAEFQKYISSIKVSV